MRYCWMRRSSMKYVTWAEIRVPFVISTKPSLNSPFQSLLLKLILDPFWRPEYTHVTSAFPSLAHRAKQDATDKVFLFFLWFKSKILVHLFTTMLSILILNIENYIKFLLYSPGLCNKKLCFPENWNQNLKRKWKIKVGSKKCYHYFKSK